jgi:hypothetical protein
MEQEKYIDIANAIDGIRDMILINKKEIGDDAESDFAKMIIQQNEWLEIALEVMLEKIEGLLYTE